MLDASNFHKWLSLYAYLVRLDSQKIIPSTLKQMTNQWIKTNCLKLLKQGRNERVIDIISKAFLDE